MAGANWQLDKPVTAIAFDCDGTLSTIEGIDALAEKSGHASTVKALTQEAMSKSGITPDIYAKRLNLILPNREAVIQLGEAYAAFQVEDVFAVLSVLKHLKKSIYVVSAGIRLAVVQFAASLRIPEENIFAVDLSFTKQGTFEGFDQTSPLVLNNGKSIIIEQLKQEHNRIIYVGDGLNDLIVLDKVTRFVGFGGSFYRKNIEDKCDFYIRTQSIAALLPLVLTIDESRVLQGHEKILFEKGVNAIKAGQVKIPG